MATTSKFDFGLINDQIKEHTDQIGDLRSNLAIIASGTDTHSSIIYKNQFVYANGILYQANTDISSGASISTNSRIANEIANKFLQIDNFEIVISGATFANYSSKVNGGSISIVKYGRVAIINFYGIQFSGSGDLFDITANPVLPLYQSEGCLVDSNGTTPLRIWLRTNGTAGSAGTTGIPQGSYSGSLVYITAN